jgi:RNA polymerase sigma-70 factor (ECF subfamily)
MTDALDPSGDNDLAIDGLDGDRLEQIFRAHAPRLTRFFRQRLNNSEEARDFVQEAFVRLAGARPGGMLRNPEAYLQRIARNLLFNRSKRTEFKLAAFHAPFDERVDVAIAPEQSLAIEAADVLKLYRRAVSELTPRTREVFLLHRIDELSYKEIAVRLGISVSTVEYHIARALVHIDRLLDQE